MKLTQLGLAFTLAALAALPARAALVISEALANEVGSDTNGEFIEIYNSGPAAIDLSNYKIGDEETSGGTGATETMQQFPAGASIGVGVTQIIAITATRFFDVYGFLPTYESSESNPAIPNMLPYATWDPDGGVINMGNGNDQVALLDGADALVDAVNWGNNSFLNPGIDVTTAPADGQSFERKNVLVDTNTRDDWQFGPTSGTAALRSTPGVPRIPEPTSAVLALGLAAVGLAVRHGRH